MLIQVLLVIGVVAVAVLLLRSHGSRHRAIRRVLLIVFAALAVLSIFAPQLWSYTAEALGVGRGTDLLLYCLVVAFLGYVASSYSRFRELENKITELARRQALDEAAEQRDGHEWDAV